MAPTWPNLARKHPRKQWFPIVKPPLIYMKCQIFPWKMGDDQTRRWIIVPFLVISPAFWGEIMVIFPSWPIFGWELWWILLPKASTWNWIAATCPTREPRWRRSWRRRSGPQNVVFGQFVGCFWMFLVTHFFSPPVRWGFLDFMSAGPPPPPRPAPPPPPPLDLNCKR